MKNILKKIAAATIIAISLVVGTATANGTELKALNHEIIETPLQIESWMTDVSHLNSFNTIDFTRETEAGLKVEDWMTVDNSSNSNVSIFKEVEAKLELKSWMTNEVDWNIKTEVEEALSIETWMLSY